MSLPKILDFSNYNRYPGAGNPTTDADMQDYLSNQNELAKALTDRLWQPETQYKVGDLVASPSMPPGLVAVCVIAGATSNVEPTWTGNETTVVDNYCTWEMRLAYSYALATNTEVGLAYKEQSVEDSHLLNLGVLPMIFKCAQRKLGTLFGSDDVLPQKYGGTGVSAASADALLKALIGSGSIGSSSQPIYYKDGKLYAGGYTFRLNHNTTDDKIPVFSNGVLDYILKSELANATTGGGIVAANLAQNGYVKFSNGLILQWGTATQNGYATSFPLTFPAQCLAVVATYGLQNDSSYWQYPLSVQNSARSSFTIATKSNWGANDTARWIAVGY